MRGFTFLILFLISVAAHAEGITVENLESIASPLVSSSQIIIKGGMGLSTFNSSNDPQDKNRKGLNLGAEMDFAASRYFSFVTGLNYIQKGIGYEFIVFGTKFSSTFRLNYLVVPMLARLGMPFSGGGRLFMEAGPYGAYVVSRSVYSETTENGQTTASEISGDVFDSQMFKYDYGARFGVGLEVPVSTRTNIIIGANYDLGLKDIAKGPEVENGAAKNRSWLGSVGFGFKL